MNTRDIGYITSKTDKDYETKTHDFYNFDRGFPDGRLVKPGGDFPAFSMKAVCAEVERLGRPLTEEEFSKFIISKEEKHN